MDLKWAVVVLCVQVTVSLRVDVKDVEQTVKLNDEAILLCHINSPLENCLFELPSKRTVSLSTNRSGEGFSYFGNGLKEGDCGLRIHSVTDENNGVYQCTVLPIGALDSPKATMMLIVAVAPKKPELIVEHESLNSQGPYKEGEMLRATCRVNNGRPAANILWYIGDERITDGLGEEKIEKNESTGLSSVQQVLERKLVYTDNGKTLRCVGDHQLLTTKETNSSEFPLDVLFGPKKLPPFERFGLVEGEEGRITVSIPSNPKPKVTWSIGRENFSEEIDHPDKKYYVLKTGANPDKGNGNWDSTLVIRTLTKEDVDQKYAVIADSSFGSNTYEVVISTSPGPKVMSLGIGTIFIIAVGILLVLIVASILIFARAKGRWCFSGDAGPRVASESSDTESAAERGATAPKKAPFKLTFKKVQSKPEDTREEPVKNVQAEQEPKSDEEGVVYAELDLKNASQGARTRLVRPEEEKTEYAEILHTSKPSN